MRREVRESKSRSLVMRSTTLCAPCAPASGARASSGLAVNLCGEPVEGVIPSITLLPDGPQLNSVFCLTHSFLSETSVDGQTFDYVDRRRLSNMRVSLS